MRCSIPVKFIAVALCALALVGCFVSILGIVQVAELGLYTDGFDGWIDNRLQRQAYNLAEDLTERYAVRKLTNCPDEVLEELNFWYVFEDSVHWTGWDEEDYNFIITDPDGNELASGQGILEDGVGIDYQMVCSVQFPVLVTSEVAINEQYGEEFAYKKTVNIAHYDDKPATVRYYDSPKYTITITLNADAAMSRAGTSLALVEMIYAQRYTLMVVLALSAVLLGVALVYLGWAAGKKRSGAESRPGALNRLPLDLYAAVGGLGGYALAVLAVRMINRWIVGMDNLNPGTLALVGCVLYCIGLIVVGFYFALCAQVKMHDAFWWKHSLLGWLTGRVWALCRLIRLPVMGHFLLIGGCMGLLLAVSAVLAVKGTVLPLVAVAVGFLALVLYGGYAYGTLLRGAKKMAEGDLEAKINSRFLLGPYGRCADHLNALAEVAVVAARNQMKSDRMKTELITNISHDIKTPLTSVINYVDILKHAQTAQESAQYLEVLGRQSQRLKKLIEDLTELSKATTGNISVDILPLDPVETVNQALGEFSDKLASRALAVVFQPREYAGKMLADGRLAWRVLSNLLSNIYKYAMPGTRVYVEVENREDKVCISLKNISREPLNLSAEELTERFVRGDASRNTEGSGLGLNIAKSLMELQKGHLDLRIDGDLFKATLEFPGLHDNA